MKKKTIDKFAIITSLLSLFPIIIGVILFNKLPEYIPTHWDFNGNINGYTKKEIFIFAFPAFMATMNLYLHFMLNSDPKNKNKNFILIKFSKIIFPIITNILILISFLISIGYKFDIGIITLIFIGIIFIVMGNYLPKSKRSYTVGIKLPWTLNSDENWKKTHKFAGFLYTIAGIFTLLSIFLPREYGAKISFTLIIIASIASTIYSYILYRKGI